MASNPEETLAFFLSVASVLAVFYAVYWAATREDRKRRKQRFLQGHEIGAETAMLIGHAKAYKIAKQLPESPYRDGYIEGVAAIEDAMQRGL